MIPTYTSSSSERIENSKNTFSFQIVMKIALCSKDKHFFAGNGTREFSLLLRRRVYYFEWCWWMRCCFFRSVKWAETIELTNIFIHVDKQENYGATLM